MAALPKTILEQVRRKNYPSKYCSWKDLQTQFALNGYGKGKFVRWLEYFCQNGILEEASRGEDGIIFYCPMWENGL